jgi:hypothetical protein
MFNHCATAEGQVLLKLECGYCLALEKKILFEQVVDEKSSVGE